jgi:PEP-CTERM motif-containing protein
VDATLVKEKDMRLRFPTVPLVALAVVVSTASLPAQTVVTPSNLQGWVLFDGSSGTSPATITAAQPDFGFGSLQFNVNAPNQQPAAAYLFGAAIPVNMISSINLGYDFFTPAGSVPAASPTIRLLLSGIGGNPNGRTDGSVGWYLNGAAGAWTTKSLNSGTVGDDFFFRLGGLGEASLDCTSSAGSFDDRRQDLALWAATCNGSGGTYNVQSASVVGVEVDWGTFVAPSGAVDYADMINWDIAGGFGETTGNYNFETDAAQSVTPEPATMSMMAFGLVGLVGNGVRRRRHKQV